MNSLADKCKNAVVTHCMVLKDKKAFSRQWHAREGTLSQGHYLGLHVRDDPYLTHTHTHTQFHYRDAHLWAFDRQPLYIWEYGLGGIVFWGWLMGVLTDRKLLPLFPSSPVLLLQGSSMLCEETALSWGSQGIRWDFTLSGLNWFCNHLGLCTRFWMGS